MKLQPGVVGWQGASSVRCTSDAGGVLNAVGRQSYSVVDGGQAYSIIEVTIARKYLLNKKGSCNQCDQVASPNAAIEHRISLTLAFPWPSRVTLCVCL